MASRLVYSTDYKLGFDSPEGQLPLYVVGYKESGNKITTFKVGGITPLYLILENIQLIGSALLGVVIILGLSAHTYHKKNFVKNQKKELLKLTEMKKAAQTKYYKEGSIDRATYQQLMQKYEAAEQEAKKKLDYFKAKKKAK